MNYDEMQDASFYKSNRMSAVIEDMISDLDTFEQFEKRFSEEMLNEDVHIGDYLYKLLDKYGYTPNKAALLIGRSHSYLRNIINSNEKNPSRDVLLSLCVLVGATVDETQHLLKYAGKAPLYVRRKRDVIIWFGLMKHKSLVDVNLDLDSHGMPLLTKE